MDFDGDTIQLNPQNATAPQPPSARESNYCRYPLNLGGASLPMIKMTLCIPIPESYFSNVDKFVFMGTPKARALFALISFIFMMIHRRYVLKAKPKRKKDGTSTEPEVEDASAPPPTTTPEERANEGVSEDILENEEEEEEEEDEEMSELEETHPGEGMIADGALPAPPSVPSRRPADVIKDALDPNWNINFTHQGVTFRKVRFFWEKVVQGPGVSAGAIIWVTFYESENIAAIFSSLLGYNSVFHTKQANMDKLRTNGTPMEKASMEIHSVAEYVRCVRTLIDTLPERVLNLHDLTDFNSIYHLQQVFSLENAKKVFPEYAPTLSGSTNTHTRLTWNWRQPPNTIKRSPYNVYYPWFICEIPPEQVEAPDTIRGLNTYLIEEVCNILTVVETLPPLPRGNYTEEQVVASYGELNPLRLDRIEKLMAKLPNKLLSTSREYHNPLFLKHNYFYSIAQNMKRKKKTLKEEDIFTIFREMYDEIPTNLVYEGPHINASKAQHKIFENFLHAKLPQTHDPIIFPQCSDLTPMGDVLFQFCENLQKYLRVHKGDRFQMLLYFFLTALPIDSDDEDLQNVAAMGPQQKGKTTVAEIAQFLIARERVYHMSNLTNKAFQTLENYNGFVIICDEADLVRLLGINPKGNGPLPDLSPLTNDLKQIFTNGGWLANTSYNTGDKENRFNKVTLFQSNGTFWLIQNGKMRDVLTSPLASRLFHIYFTDEGKRLHDADEINNNDSKITAADRDEMTGYAAKFVEFCEFVDRVLFIYNHFEMMGAFKRIPKKLIHAMLNSLNDHFRQSKTGFKPFDDRLKGREVTIIRRFTKWLCVATFFGTEIGRAYVERTQKLTLDFDVLVELYHFIQANSPSAEAIAFVLSAFSGENTRDRITTIQQLIKEFHKNNGAMFVPSSEAGSKYLQTPFTRKIDFLEKLIDVATIPVTVDDLENYFTEIHRMTMKDKAGRIMHPIRFHRTPSDKLHIEVHADFLEMEQNNNIRNEYLRVLSAAMSLNHTTPKQLITAFPLETKWMRKTVRIGGVFHPLQVGCGKNALVFEERSTSTNRSDPAFIRRKFAFDFSHGKDPDRHYTLALRRQINETLNIANTAIPAALPSYPDAFAAAACRKVLTEAETRKYERVCREVAPLYFSDMDRTAGERDYVGDIKQHLLVEHVPNAVMTAFQNLLLSYQTWNLHLFNTWKLVVSKAKWLVAIGKANFDSKAPRQEAAIERLEGALDTDNALCAFFDIIEGRKQMISYHRDMSSFMGNFPSSLTEAIHIFKMCHIFPTLSLYRNWAILRPAEYVPVKKQSKNQNFIWFLDHVDAKVAAEPSLTLLTSKDHRTAPAQFQCTLADLTSYSPLHDPDVSDKLVKPSDVFLSSRLAMAAAVTPAMTAAIVAHHSSLVAWYQIVYVYGVMQEWKTDAILYLLFGNDFIANILRLKIARAQAILDDLHPETAFAALRSTHAAALRVLDAAMEFQDQFKAKTKQFAADDIWERHLNAVDLGTMLFLNYSNLYATIAPKLTGPEGFYRNSAALVAEIDAKIAVRRPVNVMDSVAVIEGYVEWGLEDNYDISTIKTTWPSRPRKPSANINAVAPVRDAGEDISVLPIPVSRKRPLTSEIAAEVERATKRR